MSLKETSEDKPENLDALVETPSILTQIEQSGMVGKLPSVEIIGDEAQHKQNFARLRDELFQVIQAENATREEPITLEMLYDSTDSQTGFAVELERMKRVPVYVGIGDEKKALKIFEEKSLIKSIGKIIFDASAEDTMNMIGTEVFDIKTGRFNYAFGTFSPRLTKDYGMVSLVHFITDYPEGTIVGLRDINEVRLEVIQEKAKELQGDKELLEAETIKRYKQEVLTSDSFFELLALYRRYYLLGNTILDPLAFSSNQPFSRNEVMFPYEFPIKAEKAVCWYPKDDRIWWDVSQLTDWDSKKRPIDILLEELGADKCIFTQATEIDFVEVYNTVTK